ncbi:MAG: VOC family protein [Gammaproteobacteria bacterium]
MSRSLGPIVQFSYVVTDLDAAINHWAGILEVGPFFVLEHVPYTTCLYRGKPTDIDMDVALAYSDRVQIELVLQRNRAPSIFRDFMQQHGEGLHHVGIATDDIDADLRQFGEKSVMPVQQGVAENGTRFAYLDTALVPGTMLELFQLPPPIERAFEKMRGRCEVWDPLNDPPRR